MKRQSYSLGHYIRCFGREARNFSFPEDVRMADYKSDTADYRHSYNRSVSEAQERSVELKRKTTQRTLSQSRVYRIYTENRPNIDCIVSRYFVGFTRVNAIGFYENVQEPAVIIEIIASADALQDIVNLAGDIKYVNAQESVLITWSDVSMLNITSEVV